MNERIVKHGIAKVMFLYWISVILWQTFRPVENRSLTDSLVKTAIFGIVVLYAFYNRDTKNSKIITAVFAIFVLTQFVTLLNDTISLNSIITVSFMFAQIVAFLILQRDEEISEESLEWFSRMIVLVSLAMGFYSIFFRTDRFIRSFTKVGTYGSECKSFLYSNHEFALYLAAAIILSVWLLFRRHGNKYLLTMILCFLTVNLISTFSRTAVIGCAIGVIILSFAMGNRTTGYVVLAAGAFACAFMLSASLRAFVLGKVLKNSIVDSGSIMDRGRSTMYRDEWAFFLNGSLIQKLFGHGYQGNQTGGHDAYLMILNTGGLSMFAFFFLVILWSLHRSLICYRIHQEIGALYFGLQMLVLLYMVAQTPILFFSSMDCFFITMLFVMVPLYTSNCLLRCDRAERSGVA